MRARSQNPFLSRANSNRLDDDEVRSLWVGVDAAMESHPAFDPKDPMPTIVLGGKGSGKTHLFRYHSFPVQGLRYDHNSASAWKLGLKEDGYVGVYTRADGLSGSRFQGKGIDDERWHVVFRYYVELWLAQGLLDVLATLAKKVGIFRETEGALVSKAKRLLGTMPVPEDAATFADLGDAIRLGPVNTNGHFHVTIYG